MKTNEITVNGIVYVKKQNVVENIYMVRTYSAGVFYGELISREGKEVILKNARRVFYWEGAATLSELAQRGTSKPDKCKFPQPVSEVILTEAIELIPVTESALTTLNSVKIWTA